MSKNGRLVVTGQTADGSAVIVSDNIVDEFELVGDKVRAQFLWGRDDIATVPNDGAPPSQNFPVPPPGGCRFSTLTVAAGANSDYHAFIVAAMGDLAEPANPGFHRTPTMDLIYVVDGELTLEVDNGAERILKKGDSAILNGIRHRWHNRGATDATIVAVMIGGQDKSAK